MKKVFEAIGLIGFVVVIFVLGSCNNKASEIAIEREKKTDLKVASDNEESQSLTSILLENKQLPISQRIALYHTYKKENPIATNLEDEMNMYGYSLLWENQMEDALEIFKLLVAEYPESSNTYDSLAETYQKMGNNEMALMNYKKSLEMDPGNFNAEDQIEHIQNPNKKKLSPQEKFYHIYSVEEYKEDLEQLKNRLLEVHPNALKFITMEAFTQLVEEKKALIHENTTFAEFSWHCYEIVANINCSHTNISRFFRENQMLPMELKFPLQTRWIENKLYVTDPLSNADEVSLKDEIESINGRPVREILSEIYRHIQSQGYIETSKRHSFNQWSTGMIAYALGFPKTYTVQIKGRKNLVNLKPTAYSNDPMKDESKVYCGDDLCLEFLDTEKKIAVMTISSFNYYEWNNLKDFQRFVDESMDDMRKSNTQELIIDVRENGGGSAESSIHLLRYLIHEPFTYYSRVEFDGKTKKHFGENEITPFENGYYGS